VRRRLVAVAAAVMVCSIASGCSTSSTTSSPRSSNAAEGQAAARTSLAQGRQSTAMATNVAIRNAAFQPREVKVAQGQAVTWSNDDSVAHTVTGTNGRFDLPLRRGMSRKYRFKKVGRIAYYCRIHPANLWMTGVVVVVPPAQPNP
jgi:plastocyanin